MHTHNWQGQHYSSHNTLWVCTVISSMHSACITVSSHLRDCTNCLLSDAVCGKHVREPVSETEPSFTLFKPRCHFVLLLCWTLKDQTQGPIAEPNLSSHPKHEVCEVCRRTLKYASSLTAAGALRFISPVSKYSTRISKAFTVAASQLELLLWDAFFFAINIDAARVICECMLQSLLDWAVLRVGIH